MFKKTQEWFIHSLKKEFVAGLLFLVPFIAAILILLWIFSTIDGILQPLIKLIFGREVIGLGLVTTIILIWGVGLLWHNVLGRAMLRTIDKGLEHLPLFSQIYTGTKQVMESLGGVKRNAFKETVLVDFPQKGVKSLAFITNELEDENGEKIYVVYVPGSPNPTSGFLQLLRENQLHKPDLAVDCAMRMIVSCGMVTPEKCRGFGLADGYNSLANPTNRPAIEGGVPMAVPISSSELEKLNPRSCKLEEQEQMAKQAISNTSD
jgi:uncharacterized membrane protein